ncbi:MAG: Fibronectin type III domain protein, partial [Comamonadaceae bacterium]
NDLAMADWMDKFLHPTTVEGKASAIAQFAEASLQAVVASRSIVVDGRKKNVIAIVFRGTEGTGKDGIPDWLVNASGDLVPFSATDPQVLVHQGFLTGMQKFVAKSATVNINAGNLAALVSAHSADTIFWISGHSLGGALATIYGAWLEDQGVNRDNIVIHTFGAPLVGNDRFRYVYFQECLLANCDAIGREFLLTKKLNLHRVRNLHDPVPYAPYFKALVDDMISAWKLTPKADLPSTLAFGKLFATSSGKALASLSSAGYDLLVRSGNWPYQPVGYQHILEQNDQGQLLDYSNNPATNFNDRLRALKVWQSVNAHDMVLYAKDMETLKDRTPSIDILPNIGVSPQPSETPFADAVDITLTTDPGVTLYYTLDGTAPKVNDYPAGSGLNNASPMYTGPIHVAYNGLGPVQPSTLRVMAVAADGATAKTTDLVYRLAPQTLNVATQTYLQITAPDRQILALDDSNHSFYAAAGQALSLRLVNRANAPLGFASLGGKPKIFVLQTSSNVCSGAANYTGTTVQRELVVSDPAADGTVQLTFPSAGTYQFLAVAYATGGGESLLGYPVVASEPVSQATGGTGSTGSTATATHPLNDTGITTFSNDTQNGLLTEPAGHPCQDASFGRDALAAAGKLTKVGGGGAGFDFSKIANNGSVLPETAVLGTGPTDWACTRDNVTGLIWEVKTTTGLRSLSHRYTWYNSDPFTNGGAVGTAAGGTCFAVGRCDTEKFVQDVNAVGLCGASDWRMPRVNELEGIADFGRVNPAIDPTYFPNTSSSYFWSGSPDAYYSYYAWGVYFGNGYANYGTTTPCGWCAPDSDLDLWT